MIPREPMIPLDEARQRILDAVGTIAPSRRPLAACAGAVLAEEVVAPGDVLPFDNSAMDGYAVRSDDLRAPPVTLPVVTVSSAGHPAPRPIGPGEAARILTGAVLVEGADCVVRVEDTDGGTERVEIRVPVAPGANVRRAGEAARAGTVVLGAGTVLNPAHLGVAASVGVGELVVHAPPRVAVLSTGDELVPAGRTLGPGQIHETNGVVLAALAEAAGCPVTVRSCGDDPDRVRALVEELAAGHDLVLTSGGVSMGGEYDSVRTALAGFDVEPWQVAIKPAKPMAFGRVGGTVFVGLPGNPVSAVVAFELFVRPVIRRMGGLVPAVPPTTSGVAGSAITRGDDAKTHLVRVRRDERGAWVPTGAQGSQLLGGLASAEALAVLPPAVLEVLPGGELELVPLWRDLRA